MDDDNKFGCYIVIFFFSYYLANTDANPENQYMYRTLVSEQSVPDCLTCKTNCKYNKAQMSTKNKYYTHICSGPTVPEVSIFKTVCRILKHYF